jgi:hypothetical protein
VLAASREKLFRAREKRPRPHRDDKVRCRAGQGTSVLRKPRVVPRLLGSAGCRFCLHACSNPTLCSALSRLCPPGTAWPSPPTLSPPAS